IGKFLYLCKTPTREDPSLVLLTNDEAFILILLPLTDAGHILG
ncbi:hypothetical protein AVEN_171338-1, partial [Araneus ventricosus]